MAVPKLTALGAAVSEDHPAVLTTAFEDVPRAMRKQLMPALDATAFQIVDHPRFMDVLDRCR